MKYCLMINMYLLWIMFWHLSFHSILLKNTGHDPLNWFYNQLMGHGLWFKQPWWICIVSFVCQKYFRYTMDLCLLILLWFWSISSVEIGICFWTRAFSFCWRPSKALDLCHGQWPCSSEWVPNRGMWSRALNQPIEDIEYEQQKKIKLCFYKILQFFNLLHSIP